MKKEFSDLINKFFSKSAEAGLIQISTQDEHFDGKNVTVKGKEYVYFGSCSYLGLETDERLKNAAIDAVTRYGTQFSCSRTFLQMGLYEEVEEMLSEIFGKPTLLAPTTSLGHVSTIPVIMGERDAMLIDQQVHNSVRNAVSIAKGEGVYMETIPHNDMETLERRIQILRQSYDKIWYFADGVYSMYGDAAPFNDIWQLMERYEQFHFYVDDAHGMSWAGKNGRGLVLQNMPYHPKMILTSSLAKGFANCGGVLVFNDEEQKRLIKNCGSSFIFSGPLQPAVLGGIKAAAQIHLSGELETLQSDLFERMVFFVEKARQLGLAVVNNDLTPIFYVGVGKPEVGFKLINILKEQGFLCNLAHFPAVSVKNTGLRVALTRHHSLQEISRMLETVAYALPSLMEEENTNIEELYAAFKMAPPRRESGESSEEQRRIA
jgi:7-keto-8-aminopelargonate synthetase-like enzyme